jgi:hypothetical protein
LATLDYYVYFQFPTPSGAIVSGGSRTSPESITVDGVCKDATKALGNNTTWDFWLVGADESITSSTGWDFFYVEADQNILVELTIDRGADVGREEIAIEVQSGLPFTLTSDDALALYTTDFAAGTADVIDGIRIRNESGSTANIRAVLVT